MTLFRYTLRKPELSIRIARKLSNISLVDNDPDAHITISSRDDLTGAAVAKRTIFRSDARE